MNTWVEEDEGEINRICDELELRRGTLIECVGFLRAIIDNVDVKEKTDDSYGGWALHIAIRSVAERLVASTYATVDRNSGLLMEYLKVSSSNEGLFLSQRQRLVPTWSADLSQVNLISSHLERLRDLVSFLQADSRYIGIGVYRNENVAHFKKGISRFRSSALQSGIVDIDISYSQLADFSCEVLKAMDEAIRIWRFSVHNSEEGIQVYHRYASTFWKTLPRLSDLEKPQD